MLDKFLYSLNYMSNVAIHFFPDSSSIIDVCITNAYFALIYVLVFCYNFD